MHIFKITRKGEAERWCNDGWDKQTGKQENRRLLWHGSDTRNFKSILKNGLQPFVGDDRLVEVYFSDTAKTRYVIITR